MDSLFLDPNILIPIECFLLLIFWKHMSWGLILIFIDRMVLRDCFQIEIFTSFAGFNIYTVDLFTLNGFIIALLKMNTRFKNEPQLLHGIPYKALLVITTILFVNLVRGYAIYSTQAYFSQKHLLLFLAIVFYILSFSVNFMKIYRIFIALVFLSGIIVLIAYLKYMGVLSSTIDHIGSYYAYRVADRDAIMALVFTVSALLILSYNNVIKRLFSTTLFIANCIAVIIFSNLRIGWVSLSTSFVLLFFQGRAKIFILSLSIFVSILMLYLFTQAYFPDIIEGNLVGVRESYEASFFQQTSPLTFRETVNEAYINHMSTTSYVMGMPAGEFPEQDLLFKLGREAGPHNQYVSFLYYTGVPGLLCFLLINIFSLIKLTRLIKLEKDPVQKSTLQILVLGIICYLPFFYVNTFDTLYAAIIGTAMSVISSSES